MNLNRIISSALVFILPLSLYSSIHINEIMVKNVSNHVNENFNFEGWVELYNSGAESVDLSNYFFSDDPSNIYQWQYEGDTQIAPKGYAIFYFDELDTLNHVGFKLDSDGGALYLVDSEGNIADIVNYPEPLRNTSYGRTIDGGDEMAFLLSSTRLASNNGVAVATKQTAVPTFSHVAGFYNSTISVQISSDNPSAKIYYTTDGSEPTLSSLLYSSPISINKSVPLRAIAVVDGEISSCVATATYFVGVNEIPTSTKVVSLSTNVDYVTGDELGILVVGRNGSAVPSYCGSRDARANYMNDWDRPCNFELFDEQNLPQISQEVKIGTFGACSRTKPIKSIKVKANKVYGTNKINYPIFNEKENLKWKSIVLRNSGNDFGRMLFRDGFLQSLAVSGMDLDHQAYEPSVVFLNGEYYGMMGIRERTNKDFIYSNYGLDEDEFCLEETQDTAKECESFNEILDLAKQDMNSAATFMKMEELMDVNEFLNYFMTQIYFCNQDWSAGNNKLWKKNENGKWRWILYDLDYTTSVYNNYLQTSGFTYAAKCGYFSRFIKNSEIKKRLMTKFVAHAGTTFDPEYVSHFLDSMVANVEFEADYYFDYLLAKKYNEAGNWRDEVEKVRNFVSNRKDYVMTHVKDSLGLGDPLPIRIYADIEGAGFVLNDLENVHKKDFRSSYFRSSEISVTPIVPDGYFFKNWEIRQESYLVKTNDQWKYLYQSEPLDPNWKSASFDDAAWSEGEAPLGSGLTYYQKTAVSGTTEGGWGDMWGGGNWGGGNWGGGFGASVNTTTYFRKRFEINDVNSLNEQLQCLAHINDGAIIYINGNEVFRHNLPQGDIHDTIKAYREMDSYATLRFNVPRSVLLNGTNLIAVELHNAEGSSSIVFDMSLFDSNTGSKLLSTSNNQNYTTVVNGELVLKAVYEKDANWTPSDIKLYINEVCVSNNQYVDEFRQDEDWIEIYNDGTTPVDIGGMYISDKRKNLTRFQIPTGFPEKTTVPAKGYLVIWADADSSSQGPLHTNFKLSKLEPQTVTLSRMLNGELEVVDSIRYQPHEKRESFARFSYSNDGVWCVTSIPTFGAKNAYSPVEEATVDLKEITQESPSTDLKIYPNPAEDYLWLNFGSNEKARVTIADMSGRIVIRKTIKSGENLYVGDLKSDLYTLQLMIDSKDRNEGIKQELIERKFIKIGSIN